jgi:hypothetical protein
MHELETQTEHVSDCDKLVQLPMRQRLMHDLLTQTEYKTQVRSEFTLASGVPWMCNYGLLHQHQHSLWLTGWHRLLRHQKPCLISPHWLLIPRRLNLLSISRSSIGEGTTGLNSYRGYLLTVTDYWTRWCDAFPVPNKESGTVAKAFISRWVTQFGIQ